MLPLLKYTVLRLALFVAAIGVLYLLGARGVLNLALAAVVSLLLSYLLLRGPRDELARAVQGRVEHRLASERHSSGMLGLDDDAGAEDAALDGPAAADSSAGTAAQAGTAAPEGGAEQAGSAAPEQSAAGATREEPGRG